MKIVSITQAKPGEKVARDLRGADGRMILAKGTVLTDSIISRLARLNIRQMAVEGQTSAAPVNIPAKLAALEHRFKGHEKDPFMMEMHRLVKERLVKEQEAQAS